MARKFNNKPQPTAVFEKITPEIAQDWLEKYNNLNRNMRKRVRDKYARDMTNKKWLTTHQAVAFDWDGNLVDAQHRLQAIIDSEVPQTLLVVRGLDPTVRMVVDIGTPRRPYDILKLLGWNASHNDVAIVRSVMNGLNRQASIPEIVDAYEIHHDAANAVIAMFPTRKRNITIAPVLGPMARAWYSQDLYRLQTFADLLYNGITSRPRKADASVILLRDYLIALPPRGGDSSAKDLYRLTETSLSAYIDNVKLTKLMPAKVELFPLPGEEVEKVELKDAA